MRLRLLATSPRVAPGLLTRSAWRVLEAADRVLSDDAATVAALLAEGLEAEQVADVESFLVGADQSDGVVALLLDAEAVESVRDALPEGTEPLLASYDLPGARLLDLVTVMDRLRRGCPWDREQTHRSLARYLLEESYETLEAIESGDLAHLQEELGDLLLQVLFHARIAAELGPAGFDIDDVARGISDKLVYRHPHVFAGLEVADADEVERNWETLKAAEKRRDSLLDGIPVALPALAYAEKVVGRLEKAGLLRGGEQDADCLGEELLALVVSARAAGADPEQELRDAVRRLVSRAHG